MKINFIAHRHIIDKLMADGTLGRGAVCMISSVAGLGWEGQLPTLSSSSRPRTTSRPTCGCRPTKAPTTTGSRKQVMNCYVARQGYPFLAAEGIRISHLSRPDRHPARLTPTCGWASRRTTAATDTPHLVPDQMGDTMVFLNSDAASGISGVNLLVDTGHVMSSLTGSWEAGTPMINMLMGRF
jgi:hypothetical protein